MAEHPVFADAFRHRRAIVPAAAYFQRRTIGKGAPRYAISRIDGQPLAIAGLWNAFREPGGGVLATYCILTVPATGPVAGFHDRMPIVLEEADWPVWLGEVPGDVLALLHPGAADALVATPTRGGKGGQAGV